MPLTEKGEKIKSAMQEEYGKEKGERVLYASKNKGTITGIDGISDNETVTPAGASPEAPETTAEVPEKYAGDQVLPALAGLAGNAAIAQYAKPASLNPIGGASHTESQATENIGMGRPAEAGPNYSSVTSPHPQPPGSMGWGSETAAPTIAQRDRPADVMVGRPRDYARAAGARDMDVPEGGALPTVTPSQGGKPPAVTKPTGILPEATPMTKPATVRATGSLPDHRTVGTLSDYARAAGAR